MSHFNSSVIINSNYAIDTQGFSNSNKTTVHNTAANIFSANKVIKNSGGTTDILNVSGYLLLKSGAVCDISSNLNSSCMATGVVNVLRDLGSTIVGKATSDASNPHEDVNGQSAFSSITYWIDFDSFYRAWGESAANSLMHSQLAGRCSSGNCQVWDWRLRTTDTFLRNVSGDGSNANEVFVAGGACPQAVLGNRALTRNSQTFLENAIEIIEDDIGDNDGLCESAEACVYAPHIGAYQEETSLLSGACNFTNGSVTSVIMYGR